MQAVAPQIGLPEELVAEDQPDYETLTVVKYDVPPFGVALLTRWTFTEEEREQIAKGEDVFLLTLTRGHPLQPLHMVVGPEEFVAENGTEFEPDKNDGEWEVGNAIVHQDAVAEFVDALRAREILPRLPQMGLLSRQAFKELRADLGLLVAFIYDDLDEQSPLDVRQACTRYYEAEPPT